MKPFLTRWLATTLAVLVASELVRGIHADSLGTLLVASLLLGILNALVRPVLMFLALPLIVLTMGLFIFVVNALMLRMVSGLVPGFQVENFHAAFFGSIIISFVSWLLNAFFRGNDGRVRIVTHHSELRQESPGGMKPVQGRVIEKDEP